jgi:hypothetical protein
MLYRFLVLLLTLSFNFSHGLGFSPLSIVRRRQAQSSLLILSGWFDFNPFHGSGSAKEELDEQWEAQQEILRARRSGGIVKENLKQKYAAKIKVEDDVIAPSNEKPIPKTSGEKPPAPFKMPWEK